jgi:hypothetical protein
MYSYPNYIPVNAGTVRRILETLEPYPFEQIYGAWFGQNITAHAKEALRYSADRYIAAISGAD